MKKMRTDEYIYEHFNIGSLTDIQRMIMAGKVLNNNELVYKASDKLDPAKANIRFKNVKEYVSRGGIKLQHAIRHFNIDLNNKVMLDIGSSTGGFTDCGLKHGASYIYAVDVGTNQLDYSLRIDERVMVMEQTNFKDTSINDFTHLPELITIDVSFTSIVPILRHIQALFKHDYNIVALIKPQFESYLEEREAHGIITNLETHEHVINRVIEEANKIGLYAYSLDRSPIKGTKGNVEYLCYLSNEDINNKQVRTEDITTIVNS